jgi:hypothetical protein
MAKNIRRVPPSIIDKILAFDQDDLVVACAKVLKLDDIPRYAHLGLAIREKDLTLPEPFVPSAEAGRFSRANIEGLEKVRKDLPKIAKEFEVESPNWGDSSNGTHTVVWTRMVYPRDFYAPKEVELSVSLIEKRGDTWTIKFAIEQVINRRTKNFEQELLYNLNLLQENIGAADVFPSAASLADYAATIRVDWQILPPGSVDEVVRRIIEGKRRVTPEQAAIIKERVSVMARLKPEAYVAGTDGFLRYFGAKFGDDFVVFENARYGNAIYLMYESWQELSKRSRVDLLTGDRESFDRIEHRDGWQQTLARKVSAYRDRHAR